MRKLEIYILDNKTTERSWGKFPFLKTFSLSECIMILIECNLVFSPSPLHCLATSLSLFLPLSFLSLFFPILLPLCLSLYNSLSHSLSPSLPLTLSHPLSLSLLSSLSPSLTLSHPLSLSLSSSHNLLPSLSSLSLLL